MTNYGNRTNYEKHCNQVKKYSIYLDNYNRYLREQGFYSHRFDDGIGNFYLQPYQRIYLYTDFTKFLAQINNSSLLIYLYISFTSFEKAFTLFNLNYLIKELKLSRSTLLRSLKELSDKHLISYCSVHNKSSFIPHIFNNGVEIPYEIPDEDYEPTYIDGILADDDLITEEFYLKKLSGSYCAFLLPYPNSKYTDLTTSSFQNHISQYKLWIDNKKTLKVLYFVLPMQFYRYCKKFKTMGSIKLYVYSLLSTSYKKSYYFKALDTIASDLNVSTKTVHLWFNDLKRYKLIDRYQLKFNGPSYTHLLPNGYLQQIFYFKDYFKRSLEEKSKGAKTIGDIATH